MGKQIREKQPATAAEISSHPGRAWGILNIMNYHHWRHVKRRLTHRKHGGGRNAARADITGTLDASGFNNMQEHYEPESKLSTVEETPVQSTPPGKQSVKARLKALITEELSRKKGRHKRSSTYPVKPQPNQAGSIHDLERSDLIEPTETHHAVDTLEEVAPVISTNNNEMCVECGTMFSNDSVEYSQAHKHQKQPTEHQAFPQETSSYPSQCAPEEKSMQAKLLTTDVSPHLFKDFLDALDIIYKNKDLLLKFLQDPSSPLAYHFHNQQALSGKMRLTKSISFPVAGSSSGVKASDPGQNITKMVGDKFNPKGKRQLQIKNQAQSAPRSESSDDIHQQSVSASSSNKVDKILNLNQELSEREYKSSSVSSRVQNHIVINRFKDLKRKVKHVIEESKNEKRRITMDAILHKVPHGNKFSQELKKEILDQSKVPVINGEGKDIATSDCDSVLSTYYFSKRQICPMRTSSLNESVGRYSQLYANCFNKEAKYPRSERLKLKKEERTSILRTPKSFHRFLSLPNLKTYFYQSEEPSAFLPPQMPIRKFGENTTRISTTDEQKSFDLSDLKNQVPIHTSADNITQEMVSTRGQKEIVIRSDAEKEVTQKESIGIDDTGKLTDRDSNVQDSGQSRESTAMEVVDAKSVSLSDSSFLDDTIDFEKLSLPEDSEIKPGSADELGHMAQQQEANVDYPEVVRTGEDFLKFGSLSKRLNLEIPSFEVDENSEVEFNYVRDVLELSGFTDHGSLGIWYSNDQPVDPVVYEELEGCLLFDPDCSGNCNEGGHCNHLLLFDLINEILLEIFGRSYSYYSNPLSSLCHIPTRPAGDHVLREVWTLISWYLSSRSEAHPSLDYYVSRDLARNDGWMNLQFESECVGLELDDLIFDDLLEEIICN